VDSAERAAVGKAARPVAGRAGKPATPHLEQLAVLGLLLLRRCAAAGPRACCLDRSSPIAAAIQAGGEARKVCGAADGDGCLVGAHGVEGIVGQLAQGDCVLPHAAVCCLCTCSGPSARTCDSSWAQGFAAQSWLC
jgi:hypothetical protein